MATTKVNSEFIAVNAISGTIIADGAITSTHLAANCVDSSELVTGSIDTIHIAANQVTATKIVTNGILTRHISDDQVTADKLANSINTDIATGPAALPKAGGTMTGALAMNANAITSTGDLTLDAATNIVLDADGGGIYFKDGGTTVGFLQNDGGDFRLVTSASDKDFKILGNDGGSTITALTLDMSAAGAATFNSSVNAANLLISGAQGSDGQLLTSTGSGVAWEDAPAGGPTFKTFGTNSIMIGSDSTGTINAADSNTAVSTTAFAALTSGDYNVAFGEQALDALTTGGGNTALGVATLGALTTANNNTAVGISALTSNTDGTLNTAVGSDALSLNTTGNNNVAVGSLALDANTTGASNNAVGKSALSANQTGNNNIAFGESALAANTGSDNVAIGHEAMAANTTGEDNVGIGYKALDANTTASFNTAVGSKALGANTGGEYNVAVGDQCLDANTTGNFNVGVGRAALGACTTGSDHVAMGINALAGEVTGIGNTAIGTNALESANGRYYNVALGYHAGRYADGTRNIFIGYGPTPASNSDWNTLCITTRTAAGKGGSTGWIDPNGGGVYQGNNSSSWSTTSDRRIKKNIVNNDIGLEKINQIQVRNFEYRTVEEITDFDNAEAAVVTKEGTQIGVIAQEIEEILPEVVKTETTGVKGVNPDNLTWYLINAVKELSAKNDALKARVETLEG